MAVGYCYLAGSKKPVNEDALLFRQSMLSDGTITLLALSDGMGGMEFGKEASSICMKEVDVWFDRELVPALCKKKMSSFSIKRIVGNKGHLLFKYLNDRLFASMRFEKKHMGATLVVFILYRKFYYVLHLGDSRAYLCFHFYSKNFFHKLTKDHKKEKEDPGVGISKCLGLNKEWKPDVSFGYFGNCGVLLCSDGFYKKREGDLWEHCLEYGKLKEDQIIQKRLLEISNYNMRKGEKDNISALYFRQ